MNLTEEKQKNFILFFLEKNGGEMQRLELMKFIWMSDRLHLNKYGRTISKDSYCALPFGPVPSHILDLSKQSVLGFIDVEGYDVKSNISSNIDFFSKSDIEIMNYVWEKFGSMGSLNFSDYSHKFPEWLRFEKNLGDSNYPNMYKIIMDDFFEFPETEKFDDILDAQEIENAKTYFNAHSSLQGFLRS